MSNIVKISDFQNKLIEVKGKKVLFAKDVAELYQTTTGDLNKSVKKSIDLFPEEFRYQLTEKEVDSLVWNNSIPSKSIFGAINILNLYVYKYFLLFKGNSRVILSKSNKNREVLLFFFFQ